LPFDKIYFHNASAGFVLLQISCQENRKCLKSVFLHYLRSTFFWNSFPLILSLSFLRCLNSCILTENVQNISVPETRNPEFRVNQLVIFTEKLVLIFDDILNQKLSLFVNKIPTLMKCYLLNKKCNAATTNVT